MEEKEVKSLYLENIYSYDFPYKYFVKPKENKKFKYVLYNQLLCQKYNLINCKYVPLALNEISVKYNSKKGFLGEDGRAFYQTFDEELKRCGSNYVYCDRFGTPFNFLDMHLIDKIFKKQNDFQKILASKSILAAASYLDEESSKNITIMADNMLAIRRFLSFMEDKDFRSFLKVNLKDLFYGFDITILKEQIEDEVIKLKRNIR